MFVLPAPGRAVRDPVTRKLLPQEGAEVPEDSFWLRRVRDADVLIKTEAAPAKTEAAEAAAPATDNHDQAGEH